MYASLGQLKYLSALQFCNAVVGNSSSGIIEVPSFGIPTVNIGDRQRGRISAQSVINCGYGISEIDKAIQTALSDEFRDKASKVSNPYEKEGTSDRIIDSISQKLDDGIILKKMFYDIKNI